MRASDSKGWGVYRRTNADGSHAFVAQVRVQPFKPVAKSFEARGEARAWAEATARSLRSQRERGADRSDLSALAVKTLIDEFRADDKVKQRRYFDDLELLLAWWSNEYGTERVADLGVLKLRAAREKLKRNGGKPRANATVNRHLSAMRACWNWGRNAGLVPQERAWPSQLLLTEPRGRLRYLSDEELSAVLKAVEKDAPLRAAVVVSLATGVRKGELLRLRWQDVDFDRQRVRVLETKNDEPRAVHLPSVAVQALKALKRGHVIGQRHVFIGARGKPLTANSLSGKWKELRKAAGLRDFRWHDLRHSCASFLAQKGATLLEIGSVLGHRSPSVTLRYSHLVQGAPVTGHAALDEKLRGPLGSGK
jgi:integrase